ncbi:DUF962 domain-containing protein [Sphingobacterium psychroaquaticum]|uniref:DUF962 domain-containing protein n=1 Tax=Sphingobacterium psychroaquaticum TaxID=561061 RepID=A0A1X7JSE4_9SPHI|nr:hypothetical protein [Sphingobacterium psychroaquaticum]SMG31274.1 hypothetical protein SAMN05660862_2152 [Sphingobacterium psychroaquaticum]
MKKKDSKIMKEPTFERPVERHFYYLDQNFAVGSKIGYAISLVLLFFGVMGLVWMIPFPQFNFLVRMNMHTFLNWGSFYIAVVIYLYLRLAPTLSYAMLFTIGIMSFFVVQLEYLERDGGPAVWLVCALLALIGLGGLFAITRKEKKAVYGRDLWHLICIGPIWLWSKVFDKLKIKY